MTAAPVPDEQVEFLRAIFGDETGYLFVGRLDRTKTEKNWADRSFVYPLQIDQALSYVNVSDHQGFDVYIAAQLYSKPDNRKKEFVSTCPSAWSDLDTASPYGVDPEPSVILETSPGRYHGFWRTPKPMAPSTAEDLSRRIAYAYHRDGADLGGWDLTQVLRVPGTRNKKYKSRPVVKILKCDSTPIPLKQFERLHPAPVRGKPTAPNGEFNGDQPPIALTGADLEHWQKRETADRSGWAMRMVGILKEHDLSDHLVEVALATHPIYLAKAREKWGNRESLINDDIQRCIQRWRETPSFTFELPPEGIWLPGHEPRQSVGQASGQVNPGPETPAPAYPIQTLAELMARPIHEAAPLVEGLLWANRTHWWFSDPNVGKTLVLLAAGLHMAAGQPFCGLPVRQGAVLLIEEDSSLSVIAEYTDMLCDIYGFDLDALPFYVNVVQGLRLLSAEGRLLALQAIASCPQKPCLVIWDTAERLVPSDKFNTRELDQFGQALQANVNDGIANAVVDHTTKHPPAGPKGAPYKPPTEPAELLNLLYGARAKSAISDVMTYFGGTLKGGNVKGVFCKMRGELPTPIDIQFQPDTGFTIQAAPRSTRTPTEQKIVQWLNHHAVNWYPMAEIIAGAEVQERTGRRALVALKGRRIVERDESKADKQGAFYRLAAGPEVAFS